MAAREANDRWQEPIEPDIRWIRLVLGIAIALALLLPLLLMLAALREQGDPNPSRRTVPSLHPPDSVSAASLLTLVLLATGVVVVWTVVVLRRAGVWRRVEQMPQAERQDEPHDEEGDVLNAAVLGSAVRAGAAALTTAADPRTAIIACYEAMEAALAEHGSARNESDTPTEFLDRAVSAGLIRSDAAGTLTDLFREARFSRHPLGEREREAAISALARLRAEVDQIAVPSVVGRPAHPGFPGRPRDGGAGADSEAG